MALHPHSLLDEDQGATPTHENLNVFDDAFEEDDADVVADGFRPPFNHVHRVSGHQDPDDLYDPPSPSRPSPLSQTPQDPSRSSTRKSTTRENPFASPEDEDTADAPLRRTPSGNFAPFTPRATSSASSTHYATAPGPRFGAGGPSHPYAMYPQGTVARAASTASASTARPPPASSTRDGPQHPYALYPQGVSDDLDDELDEEAHNPVPVGFLGVDRPFQRRRGPDGEEQDILGYFGHTEQLPPYTRYPEDGPEKAPLLGIPEPPSALHTRAPVLGSDPGMSLMHTQIQATPQSMTDETQLLRQESGGSRLATSEHSGASTEASAATKKSWSEKSWKERRKTKFCGVPFWAFLLAAGTLSFIAVVLGGVIGGFVEGQEKEEQKSQLAPTTSSLYDASLIATATATSPTASGTYSLAFGPAQEVQASCLPVPAQRNAWGCGLADYNGVAVQVGKVTGSNTSGASLYYQGQGNEAQPLYYGTQASQMQTTWQPFLLVVDNDHPHNGPAFYFSGQYNKVVVIPEFALQESAGSANKRGVPAYDAQWLSNNPIAVAGSRPWFCFWNQTYVEGFIYANEQAVDAPPVSPSTTGMPLSHAPHPTFPPWLAKVTATPTATITTAITMPSTTCTYTGVASALPSWLRQHYPNFNMSDYTPRAQGKRRRQAPTYPYSDTQQLPLYPNLVQVEERRLPGSPPPYCVQYQVLNNLDVNWVGNAQGQQIVVQLEENDPPYSAYESAGLAGRRKRTVVPGSCHCEWWSGE